MKACELVAAIGAYLEVVAETGNVAAEASVGTVAAAQEVVMDEDQVAAGVAQAEDLEWMVSALLDQIHPRSLQSQCQGLCLHYVTIQKQTVQALEVQASGNHP